MWDSKVLTSWKLIVECEGREAGEKRCQEGWGKAKQSVLPSRSERKFSCTVVQWAISDSDTALCISQN